LSTLEAVAAVHRGAGWARLPDRALLEVRGSDRLRFLQGQLTNDVAALDPATGRAACYALALTREGRIVADCHVVARPAATWLETAAASAPALCERLARYVIADDVAIADRSADFAHFDLVGPRADALASRAAGSAVVLAEGGVAEVSIGGAAALAARFGPGPAIRLIAAQADAAALGAALEAAAAALGAAAVDAAVLEALRVEAGRPRAGAEIGPDTLPAELRLVERAVSFTKGCYTGQEIVARMASRDRVGHLLIGVRFDADAQPDVPTPIRVGDAVVGELTSAARSPLAGAIGLGIVRKAAAAPGTRVEAGGCAGVVVELPFASPGAV
jgi:folate-binding protein YgfZ